MWSISLKQRAYLFSNRNGPDRWWYFRDRVMGKLDSISLVCDTVWCLSVPYDSRITLLQLGPNGRVFGYQEIHKRVYSVHCIRFRDNHLGNPSIVQ